MCVYSLLISWDIAEVLCVSCNDVKPRSHAWTEGHHLIKVFWWYSCNFRNYVFFFFKCHDVGDYVSPQVFFLFSYLMLCLCGINSGVVFTSPQILNLEWSFAWTSCPPKLESLVSVWKWETVCVSGKESRVLTWRFLCSSVDHASNYQRNKDRS